MLGNLGFNASQSGESMTFEIIVRSPVDSKRGEPGAELS